MGSPYHKEGCSTAEGETTSFWRRLPGTWVWRRNFSIKQDRPITLEEDFRKIHLVTGQDEFIPTPARTTKYCGHFRGVGASSPSPHTRRIEWEKNRKDTDEWSLLPSLHDHYSWTNRRTCQKVGWNSTSNAILRKDCLRLHWDQSLVVGKPITNFLLSPEDQSLWIWRKPSLLY